MAPEALKLVTIALFLSILSISYLFYRIVKVRKRLQIDESITLIPQHNIKYAPDYREKALRKLGSTEVSPDQIQRDYIAEKIKHDLSEEFKHNVSKYIKEYNENNLDLKSFLGLCLFFLFLIGFFNICALISVIKYMIVDNSF